MYLVATSRFLYFILFVSIVWSDKENYNQFNVCYIWKFTFNWKMLSNWIARWIPILALWEWSVATTEPVVFTGEFDDLQDSFGGFWPNSLPKTINKAHRLIVFNTNLKESVGKVANFNSNKKNSSENS